LGLSATLGNLDELADWLGAVAYSSTWRPVPMTPEPVYFHRDDKNAVLADELVKILNEDGNSLVFVQSRNAVKRLYSELEPLLKERLGGKEFSIAMHHAGLSRAQRKEVEEAFRQARNAIIIATSTLGQGINLPARAVIQYDLTHFD